MGIAWCLDGTGSVLHPRSVYGYTGLLTGAYPTYREEQAMRDPIDKAHWADFFTDLSKTHHGYEARLEILGRAFGDQEEAAWLPFTGMSYDPHHQQIFITVGGISNRYPVHLTHTIARPITLQVHRTPEGEVHALHLVADDQTETLVHLRRQPQLAA
jgi:hypothetical protein